MRPLLRIAAIDFLNPAPLMWNFEHPPEAAALTERYAVERMTPADCAAALATGNADLGLIPIGAYATTSGLSIVPGCTIASRDAIRSLLLVLRASPDADTDTTSDGEADLQPPTSAELDRIQSVALDTSSRTTVLYTQILFRRYWGHAPAWIPHAPDLDAMLETADAAILIGDPALLALRDRAARLASTGERLRYLDLGHLWKQATGTSWVSAFWGVRDAGLTGLTRAERESIVTDLVASRDAGLRNVEALVRQWAPSLGLAPATIEHYLTRNIHYVLDAEVEAGIRRFYAEAGSLGLIPAEPPLRWLA